MNIQLHKQFTNSLNPRSGKPKRPFEKERLDAEMKLVGVYGENGYHREFTGFAREIERMIEDGMGSIDVCEDGDVFDGAACGYARRPHGAHG